MLLPPLLSPHGTNLGRRLETAVDTEVDTGIGAGIDAAEGVAGETSLEVQLAAPWEVLSWVAGAGLLLAL